MDPRRGVLLKVVVAVVVGAAIGAALAWWVFRVSDAGAAWLITAAAAAAAGLGAAVRGRRARQS